MDTYTYIGIGVMVLIIISVFVTVIFKNVRRSTNTVTEDNKINFRSKDLEDVFDTLIRKLEKRYDIVDFGKTDMQRMTSILTYIEKVGEKENTQIKVKPTEADSVKKKTKHVDGEEIEFAL